MLNNPINIQSLLLCTVVSMEQRLIYLAPLKIEPHLQGRAEIRTPFLVFEPSVKDQILPFLFIWSSTLYHK